MIIIAIYEHVKRIDVFTGRVSYAQARPARFDFNRNYQSMWFLLFIKYK